MTLLLTSGRLGVVVDGLVVSRWQRYGLDRLYVKTGTGEPVGWQCTRTGQLTVDREDLRPQMVAVLAAHPAAFRGTTQAAPTPAPEMTPSAMPMPMPMPMPGPGPVPVWTDLALNRPGQGLLAEAAALRAAHPWRFGICRLFGCHSDERAKRVGAKGEQLVADRLALLPGGWRTLHAIVRSEAGTDVDHLVIGPAGVFSINAKYHRGKSVWVGGDNVRIGGGKAKYVYESRAEARAVGRLLTRACGTAVAAQGVVAVVCDRLTIKEQPRDVRVVGRKDLDVWLRQQPADRLRSALIHRLGG